MLTSKLPPGWAQPSHRHPLPPSHTAARRFRPPRSLCSRKHSLQAGDRTRSHCLRGDRWARACRPAERGDDSACTRGPHGAGRAPAKDDSSRLGSVCREEALLSCQSRAATATVTDPRQRHTRSRQLRLGRSFDPGVGRIPVRFVCRLRSPCTRVVPAWLTHSQRAACPGPVLPHTPARDGRRELFPATGLAGPGTRPSTPGSGRDTENSIPPGAFNTSVFRTFQGAEGL